MAVLDLPDRIMRRFIVGNGGCWLWTGARFLNGYGYTRWKVGDRWGHGLIHRVTYEAAHGAIPAGLEIDHICKIRQCANPGHLRAVTHVENMATGTRRRPKIRAHCKHGHEFIPENTNVSATGKQTCRTCLRLNTRRYRARRSSDR